MLFKYKKGFSIISVLVGVTVLTIAYLSYTNFQIFNKKEILEALIDVERSDLETYINTLISDHRFCQVSLEGLTFKKKNIDEDIDEHSEGLDIELWQSNQDGTSRTIKKLSATDPNVNKFGIFTIQSLTLNMNNGTGYNYNPSVPSTKKHYDMGRIQVIAKTPKLKKSVKLNMEISLEMTTNSGGTTEIHSCNAGELPEGGSTMPLGCQSVNTWICYCTHNHTGSVNINKPCSKVGACVHCNNEGAVDGIYVYGSRVSGATHQGCSSSPPTASQIPNNPYPQNPIIYNYQN